MMASSSKSVWVAGNIAYNHKMPREWRRCLREHWVFSDNMFEGIYGGGRNIQSCMLVGAFRLRPTSNHDNDHYYITPTRETTQNPTDFSPIQQWTNETQTTQWRQRRRQYSINLTPKSSSELLFSYCILYFTYYHFSSLEIINILIVILQKRI